MQGSISVRFEGCIPLFRAAINIASFAHLLKIVDFDAIVYHVALTHHQKQSRTNYH